MQRLSSPGPLTVSYCEEYSRCIQDRDQGFQVSVSAYSGLFLLVSGEV